MSAQAQPAPAGELGLARAEVLAALLPAEHAAYFAATEAKHAGTSAVGSYFVPDRSLVELLDLAATGHGGHAALIGADDRELLIAAGGAPEAFLPDCRYLLVPAAGRLGLIPAGSLDPATRVEARRTKPGSPCSLVVDGAPGPLVDFSTLVIGPNEDQAASTSSMVWTAHPGFPVRPTEGAGWPEGLVTTAGELVAAHGPDLLVQRGAPAA